MTENIEIDQKLKKRRVQRFAAGLGGGIVLIVGIIAIPYPGPGWLIVFAGLAILGREFAWANKILQRLRVRYDEFELWVKRRGRPAQLLLFLITTTVVVVTLWLFNAYGIMVAILGLDWPWAQSPFLW